MHVVLKGVTASSIPFVVCESVCPGTCATITVLGTPEMLTTVGTIEEACVLSVVGALPLLCSGKFVEHVVSAWYTSENSTSNGEATCSDGVPCTVVKQGETRYDLR